MSLKIGNVVYTEMFDVDDIFRYMLQWNTVVLHLLSLSAIGRFGDLTQLLGHHRLRYSVYPVKKKEADLCVASEFQSDGTHNNNNNNNT